jgi:hypothetical protein
MICFHCCQEQSPSLSPRAGLVEQLEEGYSVVAGVMPGHRAPELDGFRLGRVVLQPPVIFLLRQVPDAMPVNDYVKAEFFGPADALIEELDVFVFALGAPSRGVDGESHDGGPP